MRLLVIAASVAIVVVFAISSCGGSATSPTTTTTTTTVVTTPANQTEVYTGNLNPNGAASYAFVAGVGTTTATLTSLGDSGTTATTVGIALGNWTGTNCVLAVTNDAAIKGSTVTGGTTASANVCVRIYDVGYLTSTIPYTITVTHP